MTQSKYLITSTSTPNSIVQRNNAGSFTTKQILVTDDTGTTVPIKVDTTVEGFFGNLIALNNTPDYGATAVFAVDQTGNIACHGIQANTSITSLSSINAGVTGMTSGGSIISGKNLSGDLEPLGTRSTATTLDYQQDMVITLTPTASITLSATVPIAGSFGYLIITTSGTTSRTITFSAATFKSQGTLATGIVSARVFAFSFISDGTRMIEVSRTIAMA